VHPESSVELQAQELQVPLVAEVVVPIDCNSQSHPHKGADPHGDPHLSIHTRVEFQAIVSGAGSEESEQMKILEGGPDLRTRIPMWSERQRKMAKKYSGCDRGEDS
jgi:hypothetical protein